ncbi:hypothetical protein V6C03_03830 [Methyloligella sp. 2.7D]|uniref:hypothetical protein n=1 Tax=unclassified Methyloligella TaxID=2625955 RepID=UPI00157C6977|nr:hypothetical protein [Methyloligella sp. GL2]QKP76256.1 hypothetical protein HT051_01595 [Methyloligella sp. GL2]
MASHTAPNDYDQQTAFPEAFDQETLELLQEAFDSAWSELVQSGYGSETGIESEFRTALGEKIMALASAGERDRQALIARALQSFSPHAD